jgi:ParB-like chromosome segregation protein Spo0J
MQAGRHQPLLEVEPLEGQPERYQIVCGEQRWRAARQAGLQQVLVRVLPRLSYLERFRKQLEENRLRSSLDPVEEAHAILQTKVLLDIARAEALLTEAGINFVSLESRRIDDRGEFQHHLEGLRQQLLESGVHVVRSADGPICGSLAPWRETERALGISEAARKQKVGILRLPPELQEEVRDLPAEHAIQISRLESCEHQAALVERAPELTHRQVQTAVNRLRRDPELNVEAALEEKDIEEERGPLGFQNQLPALADLCRQLARRLGYLRSRLSAEEWEQVSGLVADLRQVLDRFK